MNTLPKISALAACIGTLLLLSACAGGGGVRESIAPAAVPPPPPPPPPPAQVVLCPEPVTVDCWIDPPYTLTYDEIGMEGGRQSDHKLVVTGDGRGWLNLRNGTYRFGDGTIVAGNLIVWDTLESDVEIYDTSFSAGGKLWLIGTVRGDVINNGVFSWETACSPGGACNPDMRARIEGDYQQGSFATMNAVLGWTLEITGRAGLDGTLQLYAQRLAGMQYLLPSTNTSLHILHAGGGVSGTFRNWTGMGVFVEGALRYAPNDVYLDATRISLHAAMAQSAAITAQSLDVAGRLDRAFEDADGFALQSPETLSDPQRAFLASAASIQHIGDLAQAERTLDSLGGQAHASASQMVDEQFAAGAMRLRDRVGARTAATDGLSWTESFTDTGRQHGTYASDGIATGYDKWISPGLLVGGAIASSRSTMQLDRAGGQASARTPAAYAYAHRRAADWYATGVVGAASTTLQMRRPIDLGSAGVHEAQSLRHLSQARVEGEIGRRADFGQGEFRPFIGVAYEQRHGGRFLERGVTGLELIAQSSNQSQLSASMGLRFAQDWNFGDGGWLRLDLDARYRRRIDGANGAMQAAFAGTPDVTFDVGAWQPPASATMALGLSGGFHRNWLWTLDYERRLGRSLAGTDVFVGLRRDF
ncbi:autotransporter outer membrane beta-barrel domain-containing protein [Lysobacter sp. Root494]|uniref:autotransporter outer membrane beta-barrel domain-containing protein n=1 Tax=Lysobacter sp. Root494 TaxID=1736549 RepID=UPI0006F8FF60|nr:autotransporter outer membrane beta-barrel domain-containing protein [Lysobacter sp. Root494]KQY54980.1 hypothetical protein ASD14_02130 [Lysobacter sp. Root494]